jgi:CRISPR/Cas system-associated protein Csm6
MAAQDVWELIPRVLRDQIKLLIDQRNMALDALKFSNPVMARYASILAVRDALGAAMMEPWRNDGLGGGGQILLPASTP